MRGEIDRVGPTITPKSGRRYELHLSPEMNERFLAFFEAQTFHQTPNDLLVVVLRNGLKVLEKRKAKGKKK